jgi:hypothetical protein
MQIAIGGLYGQSRSRESPLRQAAGIGAGRVRCFLTVQNRGITLVAK